MILASKTLASLFAFATLSLGNPVPGIEPANDGNDLAERDINWTIRVYSGANCDGSAYLTYTGSSSQDRQDFGFTAGSVLAAPDFCTMLLYQQQGFPYLVDAFTSRCWQGPPWVGFSVNCG